MPGENPSDDALAQGPAPSGASPLDEDEIARLLNEARGSATGPAYAATGPSLESTEQTFDIKGPSLSATGPTGGETESGDILGADEIARLMQQARTTGPTVESSNEPLAGEDLDRIVHAFAHSNITLTPSRTGGSPSSGADKEKAGSAPASDEGDFNPEEALDQLGIDAIMAQALSAAEGCVFRHDGSRFAASDKVVIDSYDFSNPVFMTENEMRQIRIRHEQFIHHLGARLSMFLRMDFGMKMAKLYTSHYKKYIESIPNPTHISLFRLEQFTGVGIVDVNPRLAMTMVDRLLGGAGHSIREERYLTELETVLVEDVIRLILEQWCRQWEDMFELNATIIGAESNGRFLQTSPHDAIILVLAIECTLGDCTEMIQIGIPYYTIEPVIKKMQQEAKKYSAGSSGAKNSHWWMSYNSIRVPVAAEWPAFDCSVRDLLGLRPGDVLELPKQLLDNTQIRFKNSVHFLGRVGVQEGKVAVEITQKMKEL